MTRFSEGGETFVRFRRGSDIASSEAPLFISVTVRGRGGREESGRKSRDDDDDDDIGGHILWPSRNRESTTSHSNSLKLRRVYERKSKSSPENGALAPSPKRPR